VTCLTQFGFMNSRSKTVLRAGAACISVVCKHVFEMMAVKL
jgi:hypothetical protein